MMHWRRYPIWPEPVQEMGVDPTAPSAIRLIPSRDASPSGACIVRFRVGGGSGGGLRLEGVPPGRDSPVLLHEFAIPPSGRIDHLVYLPAGTKQLLLRSAEGGRLPPVSRFRVYELGSLPLIILLGLRWAGRRLREPQQFGRKVTNAWRVLRRDGVRGLAAGLVASQSARQSLLADVGALPEGDRYTGEWSNERYPPAPTTKRVIDRIWDEDLRSFLGGTGRLQLPAHPAPSLSIVVVTYNHAARSLACLRSIAEHAPADAEVIVLDNASSDDTGSLLRRLDGAKVLANGENVGFLLACNQAVATAAGKAFLLLNNDALVLPGSIQAALRTLESSPTVGVVGGRLIGIDGSLQEAGSIVWQDGSCKGYGRGDDPNAPEYRFRRDVDFVSGAFLLTRGELWSQLGGFDKAYAPSYYEDVDYCMRARRAGWRVVYEPGAAVVHYEYGSSSPAEAQAGMRRNQRLFLDRHAGALPDKQAGPGSELQGRSARRGQGRVLMVDDRVPLATAGSGAPRAASLLRALVTLGWEVTFYPVLPFRGSWEEVYRPVPPQVEVMLGWGRERLGRFLEARQGVYDRVVVSRAHNMALVNEILAGNRELLSGAMLIFDSEAIGALRVVTSREALGVPLSAEEATRLVEEEARVATEADRVAAVSLEEARAFERCGIGDVHLLGHGIEVAPTSRQFRKRHSLLFVGRLIEEGSPNVDALVWFLDEGLPLLRSMFAGHPPDLVVAGSMSSVALGARGQPGVQLLGPVEDLTPLYEDARVFIAPHRFAAGVPFKVLEAAAHGVPVVATDLLCRQLGWEPEREILVAPVGDAGRFAECCIRLFEDERLWEGVRQAALARLRQEANMERLTESLARLLA
jgi:GT2 family glycosyltransferase/glycosyltransferase involved in cell wall biosynthesis